MFKGTDRLTTGKTSQIHNAFLSLVFLPGVLVRFTHCRTVRHRQWRHTRKTDGAFFLSRSNAKAMTQIKSLLSAFHQTPIAYYPIYRDLTGSTTVGILVSQIMFWWAANGEKEFYKTDSQIQEKTRLTDSELKTAKKKLKSHSFIQIKIRGVPAKTFYDVDPEALENAILALCQTSLAKSAKLKETLVDSANPVCRNQPTQFGENDQASLAKSANLTLLKRTIKELKESEPTTETVVPHSPKNSTNDETTTLFESPAERPKKIQGKKTEKAKWEAAARNKAKELFDESNRQWQRNCGLQVSEEEGIYWDGKMIGQLTNFMNRLKFKAISSGAQFATDLDFVNRALKMFLESAARLTNVWYMDKFTPTNFVSNFEALYVDVKRNIKSGYTGDKKSMEQAKKANNEASLEALQMLREQDAY